MRNRQIHHLAAFWNSQWSKQRFSCFYQ